MSLRKQLCWQPLFGGGLRISWSECDRLTIDEAIDLLDWATEQRDKEVKAAFSSR